MGIDGIGKGGGVPPDAFTPKEGAARGASGSSAAHSSTQTKPFEATREKAESSADIRQGGGVGQAVGVGGVSSPALEGVRGGSLDVKGYIDAKVHEATAHLTHLTPAQVSAVQGVLRDQLLADPHLSELVQQATGQAVPQEDA